MRTINNILDSIGPQSLTQKGSRHLRGDLTPRQLSVCSDGDLKGDSAEDKAGQGALGASLTHVGQSSVEIGLMNRMRGKLQGYSSFNILPSLPVGPMLICTVHLRGGGRQGGQ